MMEGQRVKYSPCSLLDPVTWASYMETRFLVESTLPVHFVPNNIRSRLSLRTALG